MSTERRHLGLGFTRPALFSVLLPFRWSSGEILPAAIAVKALVSVQQFCWVPEGDVYGFIDQQGGGFVLHGQRSVSPPREAGGVKDQAYSAIAVFSVSPLLVAAWCSFKRISSALCVSPMYLCPQPQGIS